MHETPWWLRNWKWIVGGCAAVLVVVAALFVGGIALFATTAMKSSGAYEEGLATAQGSKDVLEAMGEPVKPGFFVTGSVSMSGSSGNADLAIPLSGPRGKGTLYLKAEKKAGRWKMELLELEVFGRNDRIQLLSEPPNSR